MSEQLIIILKRKLDELSTYRAIGAEVCRNALKEELQFYVLNFIYNHSDYCKWIMYGGSALRIIHGLDRMSVDLDFEISNLITENFLKELKKDIESYFINTYGSKADFLTIKITNGRGLILKFNVGKELSFGSVSNQVHVKIDLNYFIAPKIRIERQPINHGQLSFVILTYNMPSLMASKLVAIFLRGIRGVGKFIYGEKGRDIYDLLWYMNKNVKPDFDYLEAKGIEVKDLRAFFDKLTVQMKKVNDKNLKDDLLPLFIDQISIANWLKNWRESYLKLLDGYKIYVIKELENIEIYQDFLRKNFSFTYWYETEDKKLINIIYTVTRDWIEFNEGDLLIKTGKKIEEKINFLDSGQKIKSSFYNRLNQYATLFAHKNESYLKKTNQMMIGESINTKVVKMTPDNLNSKEEIHCKDKLKLLSCELDDLLK